MDDLTSSPRSRLAFAGGYSAGHIVPGLAILERLAQIGRDYRPLFIGSEEGPERHFVEMAGAEFVEVPAVSYANRSWRGKVGALQRMAACLPECRRLLVKHDIGVLVCLGSYVGVAPAIAAKTLGIPVVVFEPNDGFGLANAVCARLASSVWLSRLWNPDRGLKRATVTGVPVRPFLDEEESPLRHRSEGAPWKVLTLGGSRGHGFLNTRAPQLWSGLQDGGHLLQVTHLCGVDQPVDEVGRAYQERGVEARVDTFVSPLVDELCEADFVLTSAGAITLHEIAHRRIPALIVPLKQAADGHQQRNARMFCARTGALMCTEDEWETESLVTRLDALWRDKPRLEGLGRQLGDFDDGRKGIEAIDEILKQWMPNA